MHNVHLCTHMHVHALCNMHTAIDGHKSTPEGGGGGEETSSLELTLVSLLVMLLLTITLEYFTVTPEVSFSSFQQHMLSTGEVGEEEGRGGEDESDCVGYFYVGIHVRSE